MMVTLLRSLLALALFCATVWEGLAWTDPTPPSAQLPLVHAQMQLCAPLPPRAAPDSEQPLEQQRPAVPVGGRAIPEPADIT